MAKLVVTRELLAGFIAFDGGRPWSPGQTVDCCLSLAEWAMWLGYSDPVADFRGTYQIGQGQIDMLAVHGGALSLVRRQARAIGAAPLLTPELGCIGVVGSASNPCRQFGVIHDGEGWLTRTPTGWHGIAARALEIWKI